MKPFVFWSCSKIAASIFGRAPASQGRCIPGFASLGASHASPLHTPHAKPSSIRQKAVLPVFCSVFFCFVLSSCSEPVSNSNKTVASGKDLYTQYCTQCHGANGGLGANGAFDLSKSKLSPEQRIEVITNGRNSMASYKAILTEAEIKSVAQYTESLK
jgi:cytochrome c6